MACPPSALGGSKRPSNILETPNFTSSFQTDSIISEETNLDPDAGGTDMPEPPPLLPHPLPPP